MKKYMKNNNLTTFNNFFENANTYHSFAELLNLAKETCDYIYNNDIIRSNEFKSFKEKNNGFELIFDRVDKDDIFIDVEKKKIKNQDGIETNLDKAYSDIEDLYRDIKLEFYVNIKQMDEGIKTFKQINESRSDWNHVDFPYKYKVVGGKINVGDFVKTFYVENLTSKEDFEENGGSEIFIVGKIKDGKLYLKDSGSWFYEDECKKLDVELNEKIKTFGDIFFLNEKFNEEFDAKLSDDYKSLKKGILDLIDQTIKGDTTKLQKFIEEYTKEDSEEVLEGFTEDADIFDFYLKYQTDIDELLNDEMNYFDDAPEDNSLYSYLTTGTFDAVVYCMGLIKKELFGEE